MLGIEIEHQGGTSRAHGPEAQEELREALLRWMRAHEKHMRLKEERDAIEARMSELNKAKQSALLGLSPNALELLDVAKTMVLDDIIFDWISTDEVGTGTRLKAKRVFKL